MNKCEHCPVKCGDCVAQKKNHPAYCNKANPNHQQYSQKYIDLILHLSCGDHYPSGTYVIVSKHEEEQKEYPSVAQQAKNFFSSMTNFIKSGMETVGDDEYQRRLDICNGCEWFDHEAGRCKQCGCFMRIKAKLASEKCPIDKWEKPPEPIKEPEAIFVHTEIVNGGCGCSDQK